jgi:hypothetical protein
MWRRRYYCGQRDTTFLIYACTLGLGGIAWLADGMWTAGLVAAANRRGTAGIVDGVGGDRKGTGHVELTDLSTTRDGNEEREASEDGARADSSMQAWNAVISKAHSRMQSRTAASDEEPAVRGSDFPAPASHAEASEAAGGGGGTAQEKRSTVLQSQLSGALLQCEANEWQLHAPPATAPAGAHATVDASGRGRAD